MKSRARKILLASTLALLDGLCAVGWLAPPALGQEPQSTAQAQEKARKATPRDMRAELEAMNKQYRDNNPGMNPEVKLQEALIRANKAEMRVRELEAKLAETINRNNIEGYAAKVQARNDEQKVQENARRLAKIEQYNTDRETRDTAARAKHEQDRARIKAEYEQRSRDIQAQNTAQRAAHYAHRPIYGPLVAAPGIPEFTSLKGMMDRLKYYEQEIRLASGNGYRVHDLATLMNAKLNTQRPRTRLESQGTHDHYDDARLWSTISCECEDG